MTERDEPKGDRERKERVIHARIPPGLEEDLRRLAEALRMPVSNLIRNILHDTMTAVDRVGQTAQDLAQGFGVHVEKETEDLRRRWAEYEAERGRARAPKEPPKSSEPDAKPDPLEGVFGFQPIVLNVPAACAVCKKPLGRGASVHLGLTDRPGKRIFVCGTCVPGHRPYPTEDE